MKNFSIVLSLLLASCEPAFAASPVPTPMPTARTMIQVPLNADLSVVLNAAKPNTLYQLAPKASYTAKTQVTIQAANVSVDLNGSAVTLNPAVGGSTSVKIMASHFEIYNGVILKAMTAFRSYSDHTSIHDIMVHDSAVNQFYLGDIGSVNATLQNVTVGTTNTVSVYWMSNNMSIIDSTFKGSIGEDTIRQDVSGPNVPVPMGAVLTNVTVSNDVNQFNKESIAFRMGSGVVQNSTIHGYLRAGQNGAKGVGANVPSLIVKNTKFTLLHSPQIGIYQGVIASIQNCTFTTDAVESSVAIDGNSTVVLSNNIRALTSPTVVPKPKFYSVTTTPNLKVTETGTIISK